MADFDEAASRLSNQLSALLVGYRDVLVFAERLPKLGRVRLDRRAPPDLKGNLPRRRSWLAGGSFAISGISRLELDPTTGRSKYLDEWDTQWMCRPLVRLYVHGHIRRHAENICWNTRLLALGSGVEYEPVRAVVAEFDHLAGLRSWRYLGRAATRLPVLSSFIPAVSGIIVAIALGAGSAYDLDKLTRSVTVVGIVALATLITIWLPSVLLGFNAKRELFLGDQFPENVPPVDPHETGAATPPTRHPELPNAVVYHLENAVYDTLRIHKPTEIPLDLLVATATVGYLQIFAMAVYVIWMVARISPFNHAWYQVVLGLAIGGLLITAQFRIVLSSAGRAIIDGPRQWRDRRRRRLR